jgi:hypothetical protein
VRIGKEGLKLGMLTCTARLVLYILFVDSITVGLDKVSQFGQPIFGALTFILGRDTGVEGDDCHALKVLQ